MDSDDEACVQAAELQDELHDAAAVANSTPSELRPTWLRRASGGNVPPPLVTHPHGVRQRSTRRMIRSLSVGLGMGGIISAAQHSPPADQRGASCKLCRMCLTHPQTSDCEHGQGNKVKLGVCAMDKKVGSLTRGADNRHACLQASDCCLLLQRRPDTPPPPDLCRPRVSQCRRF